MLKLGDLAQRVRGVEVDFGPERPPDAIGPIWSALEEAPVRIEESVDFVAEPLEPAPLPAGGREGAHRRPPRARKHLR
jgi:hypothetical protein